ncbi:tRNA uridine-5-carboxymethylaminomethyl(34) synthesis GTPase MnmE, partial [Candidatus Dependentiae bacterium]
MTRSFKNLSNDEIPIVALCTPRGSGAVAMVRISGVGSFDVVSKFSRLSSGKRISNLPSHTIHHGFVVNNSNDVDEVLFLLMKGPKTYTGQDTVEITCHNNPWIIDQIIRCAIKSGARSAQGGEFTQRAVLNEKISLSQAEAVHDIIKSNTQVALQKSMAQLKGTLSKHLDTIEKKIIELVSLFEAGFEFLEEEQRDTGFSKLLTNKIDEIEKYLEPLIKSASNEARVREGIRIVIAGSPNAGKSTLFNSLLRQNRAIVSNISGTTRDSIEAFTSDYGQFWGLIDTAGLRKSEDKIEKEGISRSLDEANRADIVVLLLDSSKKHETKDVRPYKELISKHKEKVVIALNKGDLEQKLDPQKIP